MGLGLNEIPHLKSGFFMDLFEHYKDAHNIDAKGQIYVPKQKNSLMTL